MATTTSGGSRGDAPRGHTASDQQVFLYRMLYNADHPLTFDEVVAEMPGYYASDANRWLRSRNEWAAAVPDSAWTQEHSKQAMEEWTYQLLRDGVQTKRIITTVAAGFDGSIQHASRDQKVWTANRDKPPMVRTDVEIVKSKIVPWTPYIGAEGRRSTHRRRYLNKADAVLKITGLPKEVRDLIREGQKALDEG